MILVDELKPFYGRMWSHMASDLGDTPEGLAELHAMAKKIGMKRAWFQNRHKLPHYDVQPRLRALAISYGAVEVESAELLRRCHSDYRGK